MKNNKLVTVTYTILNIVMLMIGILLLLDLIEMNTILAVVIMALSVLNLVVVTKNILKK
ncbi:MAG: hypothetical protein JJT76_19590 [Clostridiaceae bacterium]|nr:hypothetical protein [Clostridiaceae bacterium]